MDIEAKDRGLPDIDLRNARVRDREAITLYFQRAESYLNEAHFESAQELRIWSLHSEGQSVREIAKALSTSRSFTQTVIERHRALAGLKGQRTAHCERAGRNKTAPSGG